MGFYENYVRLCAKRSKSPTYVGREIGVEKSTVSRWASGATPRYATLIRIADYFGITVKELTGGDEPKEEKKARRDERKEPVDVQQDELVKYLEDMREMGVLFSVARGASKEEIQKFAKVIATIRGVDFN